MILDKLTQIADGLAGTTGTTVYSASSYDCGADTNELGTGEPLCMVFSIGVAAVGSADAIYLEAISSTSGTALDTAVKVLASRLIPAASLTLGSRHVVPIPPGSITQRYIGARITCGSGDSVTADVNLIPQSLVGIFKNFPDNVTWS